MKNSNQPHYILNILPLVNTTIQIVHLPILVFILLRSPKIILHKTFNLFSK